jgi:hypothetical protein
MGALIKYDSGRRVNLEEANRYVQSKKYGKVLISPFPSGFTAEGEKVFDTKLACLNQKFKFEKGVVVATDEDLGKLSAGLRGLNLDGSLGDGGRMHIDGHGMLDFSLPGHRG